MNKKSKRLKSVRAAAKQSRLDKTSVRALHCILIQSVSFLRFTIDKIMLLTLLELFLIEFRTFTVLVVVVVIVVVEYPQDKVK